MLKRLPETLDDENQFDVLYLLFTLSNSNGRRVLFDKEISSAIAKMGDYHASVRKAISYINLFAVGTKLQAQDVTQKPSRAILDGDSAVDILIQYAKCRGQRPITKEDIISAYPNCQRNLVASGPKKISEYCHAEVSVVVDMIARHENAIDADATVTREHVNKEKKEEKP